MSTTNRPDLVLSHKASERDTVVLAAVRSPIGRAGKGSLANERPDELASVVVRGALDRVPQVDHDDIDDVICGCAQPAGEHGFNLGRIISLLAGVDAPGTTVNRYCASSLQGTRIAHHAVQAGEGDLFVSVGVECVSRYRDGAADPPWGENVSLSSRRADGVPEAYITMGATAENVAEREGISREEMDQYAFRSQRLAAQARRDGVFDREIVPVLSASGELVARDDSLRPDTTLEGLAVLKPAFREGGRVTAGNACPLNDGAAAVVVASGRRAAQIDVPPLARIVSTGVSALDPAYMGLGPIEASRQALARAGMTTEDIDVVEMNEAFAAQVIPSARALGIDPFGGKLNPHGGAIALGHPFGMTGARLVCALINDLRTQDRTYGLATLCVGGGQGMAMILERLA